MKNRNVKVIDEHNIDRNANVMFALDLEGSEYVVYWIERDEESNNVFVSKVLKNLDGTSNMLNIDDTEKKNEVSDMIKTLISTAVSDQNDKMVGTETTLSNGKVLKFVDVVFNKEQNINVSKTYITTVKKEVTKVAEQYYDVVLEETKVAEVLPSVAPIEEPVSEVFPDLNTPVVSTPIVSTPEVTPITANPVVESNEFMTFVSEPQTVPETTTQVVQPVVPEVVVPSVAQTEPVVVSAPIVEPVVQTVPQQPQPAPVVEPTLVETPPVVSAPEITTTPVVESSQPLVFSATKETNLNAALGEVANSSAIPVENIEPVREFGVETPVVQTVPQQPEVASVVAPTPVVNSTNGLTGKAGFANNKFFVVIAIAFFVASCVFLGYEVFNYFQLTK